MIDITTFTTHLDGKEPFTFAKFGDGELLCMNHAIGCNCDSHPYSIELGDKLKKSLFTLTSKDNVYIANWTSGGCPKNRDSFINKEKFDRDHFVDYNILLSINGNLTDNLLNFYKSIYRNSKEKQVLFVIPERLNGICQYITEDSTVVNVPLVNAFSKYDYILKNIKEVLDDDAIVIFASGMPSKVIIGDLIDDYSDVTFLDFGSAFDPLIGLRSRDSQANPSAVKSFFEKVIACNVK